MDMFLQARTSPLKCASHRFGVAHGEHDHVDVANSNKSSDPVTWAPWSPGAIVANVTPAFLSPLCFGSDCSRQRQCDTLQGLTCASNENGTLKYACGPSTPVYLPAGGVHKCVAASGQGADTLTVAINVILALALLLLVVGDGYRKCLGMARSSPPMVSLGRQELALSDSTDDSFMKDQKRRRALEAHFSKDPCQTTSTRHSVSAEALRLSGAAVHSDAAQATPARAAPDNVAAVVKRTQREAESPTTGVTFRSSVLHDFAVSTNGAQKRKAVSAHHENGALKTIALATAADKSFQPSWEESSTHFQLTDKSGHFIATTDKSSMKARFYNARTRRPSSPRFLTSSVAEDRKEANSAPRLAQFEKRVSKVTRPAQVPIAVTVDRLDFHEKGKQSHTQQGEDNTVFDAADSLSDKKRGHKRPTPPPALLCTDNGADSVRSPGSVVPRQSTAQEDRLLHDGMAGKNEKFQYDDSGGEKGSELARLLSRLISAHDKYASSDECSCLTGAQRPIKTNHDKVKHRRSARIMVNTDAVAAGQREENLPGTFRHPCGVSSREVRQKSMAPKADLAVQTDVGTAKFAHEPRAPQRKPLMERFVSKAADRQTPQLLQAVRDKTLGINEKNNIVETYHAGIKHNVNPTIEETELHDKITLEVKSSRQPTASQGSADGAKYGSGERGGIMLEAVLFSVPPGYHELFFIETACATQRISSGGSSIRLTDRFGNTGEARDISLRLPDITDILSVLTIKFSGISHSSGTPTTLSAQKPSKEYTTKQLRILEDTAERPLASVLASIQRCATRMWNGNTKSGVQDTERLSPSDSPPGSAPLSSRQSAIEYKTLDKATIETTSTGISETDRRMAVATGCVPEMASSIASTTRTPAAKAAASPEVVKMTAVDSHEAPKQSTWVQLAFFDWNEGTVPSSVSVTLSFVFSTSISKCSTFYLGSDLAVRPSTEKCVVQGKCEMDENGAVLHIPLPRIASCSAVPMASSRHPAFSFTERGAQTQVLPKPAGRSGRLPLTQRRDTGLRVAKDQPCTEVVKSVVMQDNKHYINHHRRTFEEKEYERFNVDDQAQPD